MFDDLRKSALESVESPEQKPEENLPEMDEFGQEPMEERTFLGLTAMQRFILALALLFMTCLLSGVCLVLTQKVVIPMY
jgi:hypothetical protein